MSAFLSLRSREIGFSNPCSLGVEPSRGGFSNRFSWDCMLEKFACSIHDEHSVISNDNLGEWAVEVPPFAVRFCKVPGQEHIMALANEEGDIEIINTQLSRDDVFIQRLPAHANAIFDVKWFENESKVITASGDMTAAVFDVPTGKKLAHFKGHTGSVKSVDIMPGCQSTFATGSRDGSIMTWDTRCSQRGQFHQAVNTVHKVHGLDITFRQTPKIKSRTKMIALDSVQSVTNVLFQDDVNLFSSGAADRAIKVWDLRKNYSTYKHEPIPKHLFLFPDKNAKKHGCSNIIFDSCRKRLFASCTNNMVFQFNCSAFGTEYPDARFFGQTVSSFYVQLALSPDDQYLLSGSSDKNAYIWKVNGGGKPFLKLGGHTAETTAVAWCPTDMFKVVTCADDLKFRIWRASNVGIDRSCTRDVAEVIKECDIASPDVCPTTPSLNNSKVDLTPSTKKATSPSVLNWLQKSSSPPSRNVGNNLQVTPTTSRGNTRKACGAVQNRTDSNSGSNRQLTGRALNFGDESVRRGESVGSKENVDAQDNEEVELVCVDIDNTVAKQERVQCEVLREETKCHKDSPTFGLPNSVVDEPVVILSQVNNRKRKSDSGQKKLDWLTSYSKQCKKRCASTQVAKKPRKCAIETATPKQKAAATSSSSRSCR